MSALGGCLGKNLHIVTYRQIFAEPTMSLEERIMPTRIAEAEQYSYCRRVRCRLFSGWTPWSKALSNGIRPPHYQI